MRYSRSPQNARHGGIISALLFVAFIGFAAMVIGGIVVAHAVHVHTADGAEGSDVTLDTPGGVLKIRSRDKVNPELAGVPVYPGARRTDNSGGASFEWSSSHGHGNKAVSVIGAEFITTDSASDVENFYRRQWPSLVVISEENKDTRLEYKDGDMKRIVSIRAKEGETRIGLGSIGGRESN